MPSTLIVALGSTVMTDDAIGYHVLQKLQEKKLKVDFAFLGQDIFKLRLFYNKHKRVIIIDSLTNGYPVGSVICFNEKKIQEELEAKTRSAHFIGSIEALNIMKLTDGFFARVEILFVGIVIKSIAKGLELTNETKGAVAKAVKLIVELLEKDNIQ